MIAKSLIVIRKNDFAFLRMGDNTRLEIIADSPGGNSAEVFIHPDMAAQESVHLHVPSWFDIRILTVWKNADEKIDSDQIACRCIDIVHCGSRPVNLGGVTWLMLKMVGKAVLYRVLAIAITVFRVAHRYCVLGFTFVLVLLPEELECDTYLSELPVHVFVIGIPLHGLFRMLVWIKHPVNLVIIKVGDIGITDALLIGDMKNIADGVP